MVTKIKTGAEAAKILVDIYHAFIDRKKDKEKENEREKEIKDLKSRLEELEKKTKVEK